MERSQSHYSIRQVAEMSLFAGISFVLMYISFPIIPFAPWMKIDFSDIPILLGAVIFGPLGGVLIAAIKGFLYWLLTGVDVINLIGILASFAASVGFLLPIAAVLKHMQHASLSKKMPIAIISGTVVLTVVMALANLFVLLPVYAKLLGMTMPMALPKLVLIGVIPFNIIKGILVGGVFWLIVGRMKRWLNKQGKMTL
ncbi:ECF transporter S component [Secundilactobacillus malefermentans]|uniref:ECF transporter S component n=1 Tax=Secundilactobacillus malefermentans TaxID=176292 RepID=UPI001CDC5D7E|nr:ECF transporter S component [Secundilactobacillus malefermentans]